MKPKQTDNSFFNDKVLLRLNNIPKKQSLFVLDAFSGSGSIWKDIQKKYPGKITTLKIDKEKKQEAFVLLGNNQKYLESLDLGVFDVIDLDAYGIPYQQLKTVFKKKYKGIIFVTFIQTLMGTLPFDFLEDLGYTKAMVKKCPTLFFKNGFEKLCSFLKINGVERIKYRQNNRKTYLCFSVVNTPTI